MRDTTMQHAGLMLWNMAFHPFPTLDGEKKAAIEWAPYKTRRPTQAEIRKWWPPGSRRNIALVLGPLPRLLVLNVNQKHRHDGLSTLRRHGRTLPPTPTIVTPHDGFAYCFKPPDRQRHPYPFKTHPTVRGHPGIELRGEGGYQLVPPSSVAATARATPPATTAGPSRGRGPTCSPTSPMCQTGCSTCGSPATAHPPPHTTPVAREGSGDDYTQ